MRNFVIGCIALLALAGSAFSEEPKQPPTTPGSADPRSVAGSCPGTGTASWASVPPEFRRTSDKQSERAEPVPSPQRRRLTSRSRASTGVANKPASQSE